MMGYTAASKAEIRRALKDPDGKTANGPLDFLANVQETSFFGIEQKVPGDNFVVGPDAYTRRQWYGKLTVDAAGWVIAVK
jgi:hypothetical protein